MSTLSPSADALGMARMPSRGSGTRRLRLVGRGTRFALMVGTCLLASALALGLTLTRYDEVNPTTELTPLQNTTVLVCLLAMVVSVGALWQRHTAPYAATLVAAAIPLVLPLDATASLFTLAALLRSRRDRWAWACVGLVGVATTVALFRDASGGTTASSGLKMLLSGAHEPGQAVAVEISLWVPVIVALVLLAGSVASGLFMRNRRELVATQHHAHLAEQSSAQLSDRLGRQAERDLIAREVHDVIGHRLSLLSLHAGGLQVAAGDDERLCRSAALVRENAQQAMDDLQSLLQVLREPEGSAFHRTASPSLTDLPAVIEETVDGGMPVISTVYLSQAEHADPALARAVYRIVQELLTNARRHAPGAPVRLVVEGGPETGIRIETANRLTTHEPGPAGNGLTGISERVALWQGTLRYGLDDDRTFRVAAHLPWRHAPKEKR